jgi:uncharacterized cupin superfamily protein
MGKYEPSAKGPRRQGTARAACIANIDELEPEPYEREKDGLAGKSWDLGEATGARLLGADVTEIPPGKKSSHFHTHSQKEEFFFVLSGRCRLRLGKEEHELRPGDAVSRPAGTGVGHQFFNPYAEPCRVMMLGVQAGKGFEDMVEWPELGSGMRVDEDGKRKLIRR